MTTLDAMSQRRALTLSLLAFLVLVTAIKVNVLAPFDEAAEAWVQQQVTPVRTALMLLVTQLASTAVMVVLTALAQLPRFSAPFPGNRRQVFSYECEF